LKLSFITVSSRLPAWLEEVLESYKKKLSYWFKIEVFVLKSTSLSRHEKLEKKTEESAAIHSKLLDNDYVIVCDERGIEVDSIKFANILNRVLGGGKKRLMVVVGGAFGLSDDVLSRADLKLSLSKMTMNHHIALAMACEQVYRAMTILKGINYHND